MTTTDNTYSTPFDFLDRPAITEFFTSNPGGLTALANAMKLRGPGVDITETEAERLMAEVLGYTHVGSGSVPFDLMSPDGTTVLDIKRLSARFIDGEPSTHYSNEASMCQNFRGEASTDLSAAGDDSDKYAHDWIDGVWRRKISTALEMPLFSNVEDFLYLYWIRPDAGSTGETGARIAMARVNIDDEWAFTTTKSAKSTHINDDLPYHAVKVYSSKKRMEQRLYVHQLAAADRLLTLGLDGGVITLGDSPDDIYHTMQSSTVWYEADDGVKEFFE